MDHKSLKVLLFVHVYILLCASLPLSKKQPEGKEDIFNKVNKLIEFQTLCKKDYIYVWSALERTHDEPDEPPDVHLVSSCEKAINLPSSIWATQLVSYRFYVKYTVKAFKGYNKV